jgi:hypothetical protein
MNNQNYILEKSKDNLNVIKIKKDNKYRYIGSKYSVQRDIEKFLKDVEKIKENEIFIVFGLGTGIHILELLNKVEKGNKILVVEPDVNILDLIKTTEEFKQLSEDNRVHVCIYDDNIIKFLKNNIEEYNTKPIRIVWYSNYDKLYETEFKQFIFLLKSFISEILGRNKTSWNLSRKWFECYMKNFKYMIEGVEVNKLENNFKNIPSVVVSAGPSLSKNIKYLNEIQSKCIIICGGRTLKPLLDIGIKPDFVCIADPGEPAYNLVKDVLDTDVPLVFYEGTNYKILEQYKGKNIYYTNDKTIDTLLSKDIKSLGYGGSVAHTCIGLAQLLGCNPVMFIGQDCAYTDEKKHDDICSSKGNNNCEDIQHSFYVEDIYGNKVRTNTILNSFRHRIEQMIEVFNDTKFINCTEGGANIKGTKIMTLKEASQKYMGKNKVSKNIKEYREFNTINTEEIKLKLKYIINQYEQLKDKCTSFIEYCNRVNNVKKEEINNILNKLDSDFLEINKSSKEIEFAQVLIYPIINDILGCEEYVIILNEDLNIKLKKLLKRNTLLYEKIIDAVDFAVPLIKLCIKNINE